MAQDERINEVLRRQRNADNKVRRLEAKGIRIRNSGYAPHRTPAQIRSMSPMQLAEHEARLTAFTSRTTQFVPGVDNNPIPKAVADEYKGIRDAYNKGVDTIEGKVKPLTRPGSDTTIETVLNFRDTLTQQGMRASQRVLSKDNRSARNFQSAADMRKAIDELRYKASDRYIKTKIEKRLNSIRAALTYSGNVEMVDMIDELSWSKKLFLLDYSLFGNIASLNIDSGKYDSSGSIRDDFTGDDIPTQDDELLRSELMRELRWVQKEGSKASFRGTGRRSSGGGRAK